VYGTDGCGAKNLIVPAGGMRQRVPAAGDEATLDSDGNLRSEANLYMNGPEIFSFTLRAVPKVVVELLARSGRRFNEIDLFVFHQANQYMLEHLRKKLKIAVERFFVGMRHCGNTVSCTIPIALKQATEAGRIQPGHLVMLVGFGVGYSWGATLVRWV
jgi:3-oxoacyl-[acyl-carrier-protein] synthase-3